MHVVKVIIILTFGVRVARCLLDPVTLGIGAAVGLGTYGFGFIKDQTYCRLQECCDERSIPADIQGLRTKLKNNLFGQHIVLQQLIPALEAHYSEKGNSRKPLVISFHGTPGTGKNFVADQIAESLYTRGLQSKYVHKYLGRSDFPISAKTDFYQVSSVRVTKPEDYINFSIISSYVRKERINNEVRNGIAECPRSLFIFDEVDKMPTGVFESLASLVDYNAPPGSSQAVFIFLSNTAGVHILDGLAKLIKSGTLREEAKLSDFEQTLRVAAYNLEGGMQKTSLIESHVIDHYIPFLPLEKEHVCKCLMVEFNRWNKRPTNENIDALIKAAITFDRSHGLFATSGCKTLEKKVAVEVHGHQ